MKIAANLAIVLTILCGCQTAVLNSKERALAVIAAWGGEGFSLTSEGGDDLKYTLSGILDGEIVSSYLRPDTIFVSFDPPGRQETMLQRGSKAPRPGPFLYEDPASVKALIESKSRLIFPGHAYVMNHVTIRKDKKLREDLYEWGMSSARFNIIKGGYIWVDRLCGTNVEIDNMTGRLVYYQDRVNVPPIGTAQTGITEAAAIAKAAKILKTAESNLTVTDFGWAARDGEQGVLCYRVRKQSIKSATSYHSTPAVNLYIRAKDGAEYKRT